MRLPAQPTPNVPIAVTLVELMVVIVLVAVMSALILPEMAGTYADAKLKSTARRLITLCGFANSQAISHNQTQRIRFDHQARRYRLESGTASAASGANRRSAVGDPETEGEWDPSIRLHVQEQGADSSADRESSTSASKSTAAMKESSTRAEGSALIFYGDGTALARKLTLEDRGGFRVILEINPTTSRVRIADPRHP